MLEAWDDALTQLLHGQPSRRRLVAWLSGLGLATVPIASEGKRRRKRKKRKRRCPAGFPVRCPATALHPKGLCAPDGYGCCPADLGGGACPLLSFCCPPSVAAPGGSCVSIDAVCCPADVGGGGCPLSHPRCCAPTPQHPQGLCLPVGFKCCSAATGGGACLEADTCCAPFPGFPAGACAAPGTSCPRAGQVSTEHATYHSRQRGVPRSSTPSLAKAD